MSEEIYHPSEKYINFMETVIDLIDKHGMTHTECARAFRTLFFSYMAYSEMPLESVSNICNELVETYEQALAIIRDNRDKPKPSV